MVVHGDTTDANIVCKLCQRNQWIKKKIFVIFALFDGNVYICEKGTQIPQALLPYDLVVYAFWTHIGWLVQEKKRRKKRCSLTNALRAVK